MWYYDANQQTCPRIRYDAGSIPVAYYDTGSENTWRWIRSHQNYGQLGNACQGQPFAGDESARSSRSFVGQIHPWYETGIVTPPSYFFLSDPPKVAQQQSPGSYGTDQFPQLNEMHTHASAPPEPLNQQNDFTIKAINGDGDCLFTAVADELVRLAQSDRGFATKLTRLLKTENLHRTSIAQRLREICVREWLDKEKYYKAFMNETVNFKEEADRFLRSGYYQSPLGDIAPLTISNVLEVALDIRTTNSRMPTIRVRPSTISSDDESSIHVINLHYTSEGSGHYDVALPKKKVAATPISIVRY